MTTVTPVPLAMASVSGGLPAPLRAVVLVSAEVLMMSSPSVVHAADVVGRGVAPDRDARAAVHPDRYRPGHGDALAAPVRGAVVGDRVVLGGAVVPDGQVALAPAPADRVLGPGDVVLQQPDQVPRRLRGETQHG